MAKFEFVKMYAVAATLRTSPRATRYLMVECSDSDTAKGGAQKLIGEWDPQLDLFDEILAQMPADFKNEKRYRLVEAVELGLGCAFNTERGVPRLVARRFVKDEDGNLEPQDDRLVNSVRGVALKRYNEDPNVMIDAEIIRRCMLREIPKKEGTQYLPIRGEDYSRYYIDIVEWKTIREELFGDVDDDALEEEELALPTHLSSESQFRNNIRVGMRV